MKEPTNFCFKSGKKQFIAVIKLGGTLTAYSSRQMMLSANAMVKTNHFQRQLMTSLLFKQTFHTINLKA